MYKAIGIWSWPRDEDRAQFDEHYEKVHYPLAEKLPGARPAACSAPDAVRIRGHRPRVDARQTVVKPPLGLMVSPTQ